MEKCPKCGAEVSWTDDRPGLSRVGFKCLTFITSMGTAAESVECCKRQLAAANERAVERANDYARVLSQIAYCHEKAYMAKDALKRHGQFGAFPPYTNDDDDEDDYGPELGGDL